MADGLSFDDLQEMIRSGIAELRRFDETARMFRLETDAATSALARALRVTLFAMSSSLGECRLAVPYSPLHPVIDADGNFCWCCNHDPEHCRR